MDADRFWEVQDRLDFVYGDLHAPGLGIDAKTRERLLKETDSVLHIAASLNRKSAKACLNTNLRGTLSVVKLARSIADKRGLRRYSHVSTTAVAGERAHETVYEDTSIDWDRSDYDPYARTKKFCEHMAVELLEGVQQTFFRPSIVMGDSRKPLTSQFDMVGAFCGLARMPLIPIDGGSRFDIAPADFVGEAIARLHLKPALLIAEVLLGTGDRLGAATHARRAVALSRPSGMAYCGGMALAVLARAEADPAARRDALAEAERVVEAGTMALNHLFVHGYGALVGAELEDPSLMRHHADALERKQSGTRSPFCWFGDLAEAIFLHRRGERGAPLHQAVAAARLKAVPVQGHVRIPTEILEIVDGQPPGS